MCGRFAIAPQSAEAWAAVGEVLGAQVEQMLKDLEPRYNVAPTTQIPIIIRDPSSGEARALLARWGFIPHWHRDPQPPKFANTNARSEDVASKPAWRDAWRSTRCLIPASHWYEWQKDESGKQPFAMTVNQGKGFMFAGLYSLWAPPEGGEPVPTCAILTRAASDSVAHIHDRMPVILHPDGWLPWLDPRLTQPAEIAALLADRTVLEAEAWRISSRVNTPRNDDADVLSPV